jgi:hypothetical protein
MTRKHRPCQSCGEKSEWNTCCNCVCSVPDCESIAVRHAKCFTHWLESTTKEFHECDKMCWQCKQTTERNHSTFRILLLTQLQIYGYFGSAL